MGTQETARRATLRDLKALANRAGVDVIEDHDRREFRVGRGRRYDVGVYGKPGERVDPAQRAGAIAHLVEVLKERHGLRAE